MPTLHTKSNYADLTLLDAASEAPSSCGPIVLADVRGQFKRVADRGTHIAGWDSEAFKPKRHLRYTGVEGHNLNVGKNHMQGIQRRGRYLFVTGGDSTEPIGHLLVLRMDSRRAVGPWGSNVLFSKHPPASDGLVRVIALDKERWHAGGASLMGDLLAIPLEPDEKKKVGTRVAFLDVSNPEDPKRFGEAVEIHRAGLQKAGAVALTRLPDQRFLCAVSWDEKDANPPGRIDLYASVDAELMNGFNPDPIVLRVPQIHNGRKPSYQSIAFVCEDLGGVRAYYMIGTENTSAAAPFSNGVNWADLFRLQLDVDAGTAALEFVDSLECRVGSENGNFDAAAGIHVDANGVLSLYSAYHWRLNNEFRMSEFHGRAAPDTVLTDLEAGCIELYENTEFRGRGLALHGTAESSLPDYSQLFVQGDDFDEIVSSVRFRLPQGIVYRLYRRRGFQGNIPGTDFIDLIGQGVTVSVPDLSAAPHRFGDRVRSSRFLI